MVVGIHSGGMFRRLRSHMTYANGVSTLCLFILLGGGAYAATTYVGAGGALRGCIAKDGTLRMVKPGKMCPKHETAIGWSEQGPSGDPGPAGPKGEPGSAGIAGAVGSDAQTLQGHPAADFLSAGHVLTSGRVTASNPNNETNVEVPLISNGTFSLTGECLRNNVGNLQTEVWLRSTQPRSYLDSFGNGTDGALSRSLRLEPPAVGVLTVVPPGRYDTRSFVAVAPNGSTLTGTVSSGTGVQGDCVFTAVGTQ
jgi:hypothetical protein